MNESQIDVSVCLLLQIERICLIGIVGEDVGPDSISCCQGESITCP